MSEKDIPKETEVLLTEIYSPEVAELGRLAANARQWVLSEPHNLDAHNTVQKAAQAHGLTALSAQAEQRGAYSDEQKVGWREDAVEDIRTIKLLLPEKYL